MMLSAAKLFIVARAYEVQSSGVLTSLNSYGDTCN